MEEVRLCVRNFVGWQLAVHSKKHKYGLEPSRVSKCSICYWGSGVNLKFIESAVVLLFGQVFEQYQIKLYRKSIHPAMLKIA
jgi:hypothetical protein